MRAAHVARLDVADACRCGTECAMRSNDASVMTGACVLRSAARSAQERVGVDEAVDRPQVISRRVRRLRAVPEAVHHDLLARRRRGWRTPRGRPRLLALHRQTRHAALQRAAARASATVADRDDTAPRPGDRPSAYWFLNDFPRVTVVPSLGVVDVDLVDQLPCPGRPSRSPPPRHVAVRRAPTSGMPGLRHAPRPRMPLVLALSRTLGSRISPRRRRW